MKNLSILVIFIAVLTACKNDKKEELPTETNKESTQQEAPIKEYPVEMTAVFNAHGGLNLYNKMNNLCFEIKEDGDLETHTISLKNRKSKIETKNWTIGYDGEDAWLLENEAGAYKGNARFYHNLMFYFYAMPFVTADDGIVYTEMEPTTLDGKTYNATKIGYDAGVGDSPKDEYIVFSDPETHTMEWLGYTVTFGKDQKSDKWSYIKYDDWTTVNGLVLPKKLTWFNVEDNKPVDERNDVRFKNIIVTETKLEDSVFKKPEAATVAN